MMFEWNIDSLSEFHHRDESILPKVIGNMRLESGGQSVSVRFGIMGTGQQPNYEICVVPNSRVAYLFSTHNRSSRKDEYEDKHLSRKFTLAEIEEIVNSVAA